MCRGQTNDSRKRHERRNADSLCELVVEVGVDERCEQSRVVCQKEQLIVLVSAAENLANEDVADIALLDR